MPSVPRLLAAIGLVLSLSAQSDPVRPEAPIDPAVWSQLTGWQKDTFNKKKSFAAVQDETAARLRKELQKLLAEEYPWQERNPAPTPQQVERFIASVRSLKSRFPFSSKHPEIDRLEPLLRERAAFYEQEQVYKEAHPRQGAAASALKKRAATLKPGAGKEELDKFFENEKAGAPGGQVAAVQGAKATPVAGPGARAARIDGSVPAPLSWRFEPGPTTGLSASDLAWRKSVNADGKEKHFAEVIMGTLNAPVERDILEAAAREQALAGKEMERRAVDNELAIEQTRKELKRPGLSAADKQHLDEQLVLYRKNLSDIRQFSPELIVSMADLPENTGGRTYIDDGPGPDGKQHVRVVFNRILAWNDDAKGNNTKDAARKIAAHEFTHVGDFYGIGRDAGPSERYLEPRAFRNGALSYKQEGMPQGKFVERWAAQDYRWLRSDPVAWMNRQVYDYSQEGSVGGPGTLWNELTPDDFADPAEALDWRLQYVYRYSTAMAAQRPGEEREAGLRRIAQMFLPGPIATDRLIQVEADTKLNDSRKASEFARLAASAPFPKDWVKAVRKADKATIARARQEEQDFIDSLNPLFP